MAWRETEKGNTIEADDMEGRGGKEEEHNRRKEASKEGREGRIRGGGERHTYGKRSRVKRG